MQNLTKNPVNPVNSDSDIFVSFIVLCSFSIVNSDVMSAFCFVTVFTSFAHSLRIESGKYFAEMLLNQFKIVI